MVTQERLKELLDYDQETGAFTWRTSRGGWSKGRQAGTVMFDGYRRIGIDGRQYHAHKLAWLYVHGVFPDQPVDHADLDKECNAIANLRLATVSQNAANSRVNSKNTSGYKGVSRIRESGKWLATIKVMGKSKYLGTFDDPEAAHEAYVKAAASEFGEFARAG